MVRAAALLLCLWAAPVPACRLALVLALDVSSSVDTIEDRLQRSGLAAALTAPDVVAAFLASEDPVHLMVFEWSGQFNQAEILPWLAIVTEADLLVAAARIAESPRSQTVFPTAMGAALGYAATALARGPDCAARTIDMAGDGVNNDGYGPAEAYAAFPFDDITVNGLVIDPLGDNHSTALLTFYLDEVRRGADAFVEIADGFPDFERTMRRKLLRELSVITLSTRDPGPVALGNPG